MRDTRLLVAAAAATFVVLSGSSTALMLRKPNSPNLGQQPSRGLYHSSDTQDRPTPGALRTGKRGGGGGVSRLRASWIDEQVSLELPTSSYEAYCLYSDLRRQPEWSPWLRRVEHDRESGQSTWVIQSRGIKVSWNAQNTVEVPGSEVAWESTTGLINRGRVTFQDTGHERCMMTLTLSYNLPGVIARVLKIDAVTKYVKWTLLGDLSRFKKVLVRQQERSRESANVLVQANGEEVAAESGQDPRATATATTTTTGRTRGTGSNTSPISRERRPPNPEPLAFHTADDIGTEDDQETSNNGGTGEEAVIVPRNVPGGTTAASNARKGDGNNMFDDAGGAALKLSAQELGDTTTCSIKEKVRQNDSVDRESSSAGAPETKNSKMITNGVVTESGRATGWLRRKLWRKLRRKERQHQQRRSGDGVEGGKGSHDTSATVRNGGDLRTPWSRRWRSLLRRDADDLDAHPPERGE